MPMWLGTIYAFLKIDGMMFERSLLSWGLTFGLLVSGQGIESTIAHECHDHDAMKAEKEISDTLAKLAPSELQRYQTLLLE